MPEEDLQPNMPNEVESKKSKIWLWVLIAVVITLVITAVGVFLPMARQNAKYIKQVSFINHLEGHINFLEKEIERLKDKDEINTGKSSELEILEIAENSQTVKKMKKLAEEKKHSAWHGIEKLKVDISKYNLRSDIFWRVDYSYNKLIVVSLHIDNGGQIQDDNDNLEYLHQSDYCINNVDCMNSGCCGGDCKNKIFAVPSMCDMVCPWEMGDEGPVPCKCIDNKCGR